jgi:DNA repair protein RadC
MSIEPLCPIPDHERPRERMRRLGIDALADAELLALVLGTGRPNEPVESLAARLLADYGGARGLCHAGAGELAPLIGFARAARLLGAVELARRALTVPLDARTPYASSRDVVRAFGPRYNDRTEEYVLAVVLDARHRPLAERVLAIGGPASCVVSIREILALAIREGGAAFLLVHNHPSGEPAPSRDDIELTTALVKAGDAVELPLIDHVILAREGSFSFLDAGLLRAACGTPTNDRSRGAP